MAVRLKRIYDDPASDDGFRVLVDRLWPRGLTKEGAAVDLWAKDAAPSTALRQAFHRDGLPWDEFEAAYDMQAYRALKAKVDPDGRALDLYEKCVLRA